MILQLAELGRRNKHSFRPKNRQFDYRKFYVNVPAAGNIKVREDVLDDYSDEQLSEAGVELSKGGRKRRKERKQQKHEQKIAKKSAKTEIKLAKADKKRAAGEAKKGKAQAKIDKANNPKERGSWKDTAADVLDTAGNAFAKYQEIKRGGAAPDDSTGMPQESFFDKNKMLIISGGVALVGLIAYSSMRKSA